jgi:Ohr subfamily peroxiredoxin
MKKPSTIVYQASATVTGGREGSAKSDDGRLAVSLSTPKGLGGNDGPGTNPEQLFAAGYAACFMGATRFVAGNAGIALPDDFSITSNVGIGPTDGGFAIDVELLISLPGMDKDQASQLIEQSHQVCPYSNATRGNIDVRLTLAG